MIHNSRGQFAVLPVERACALLNLDRSGYYRKPEIGLCSNPSSDQDETVLRDAIENIVLEFAGYGYRRVTAQLVRDGWSVNRKRVLRIMRQESLLCQLKRRWVKTTDSVHGLRVYPNLLRSGTSVERLNQVWVADITYIRLPGGFWAASATWQRSWTLSAVVASAGTCRAWWTAIWHWPR
jgi:hypothetical protein